MIPCRLMAAIGVAVSLLPFEAAAQEATADRTITIMAIEHKMRRSVEETPFPSTVEEHPELADAPGFRILAPGEEVEGEWGVDAYQFLPGSVVVNQGEDVLLRFFGVNGDEHPVSIEGYGQEFTVRRGELTEVRFVADQPGIFEIVCNTHVPTMVAQLVVQTVAE